MMDVTPNLNSTGTGIAQTQEQLFDAVYAELRQIAAAQMAKEKPGQTLEPTALVHEAWMRLMKSPLKQGAALTSISETGAGRRYFFAAAAEAMRRILIEQARRKKSIKHGGLQRLDVTPEQMVVESPELVLDLQEALDQLSVLDQRKAELVKLRYFTGLSLAEIAEILSISEATAERDWTFAKAWLFSKLQKDEE